MNKGSFVYIRIETSKKPEKTLAFFILFNVLLKLVAAMQVLNKMKLVENKQRGRMQLRKYFITEIQKIN